MMRTRPQLVAARVTGEEKKLIIAAAEAEGVPVSEFALRVMLERAAAVLTAGEGESESEPTVPES